MSSKSQSKTDKSGRVAGMDLPPVIFGTSGLGNLFVRLEDGEKLDIVRECVRLSEGRVVFDSAGKYGAGLALEVLGRCLKELGVPSSDVVISNKLGWLRTTLTTTEPTFEPGVWKDLEHDAVQKISYDGILECFEQGNQLLGGYIPKMVSVHDPDEYLAAAADRWDEQRRYGDVLEAYRALFDLKRGGRVESVGVGAKDWKTIQRITGDVSLDWVMIANSLTVKRHPPDLVQFIKEMEHKGVYVINSAVFHSGFLVGGGYFDYRQVTPGKPEDDGLLEWREAFFGICREFGVRPAEACVRFALDVPGVGSVALNTTNAMRVKENVELAKADIPDAFWEALKKRKLTKFSG